MRNIFPLICSKNDINRLHEAGETTWEGETTGEVSCLASAGMVARVGETTFLHVNGLARPPGMRQ